MINPGDAVKDAGNWRDLMTCAGPQTDIARGSAVRPCRSMRRGKVVGSARFHSSFCCHGATHNIRKRFYDGWNKRTLADPREDARTIHTPPTTVPISLFSCSFWSNVCQLIVWRTSWIRYWRTSEFIHIYICPRRGCSWYDVLVMNATVSFHGLYKKGIQYCWKLNEKKWQLMHFQERYKQILCYSWGGR